MPEPKEEKKAKEKKIRAFSIKLRFIKKTIAICVVIVAVVVLLTYVGTYLAACNLTKSGEFTKADKLLFASPITSQHDPNLVKYVNAGLLMEERKFEEAKTIFAELGEYLDADLMVYEADYRRAEQCADANDFDTAITLMGKLHQVGYKDASQKVQDIQYRNGMYLLYEEKEFYLANEKFKRLANNGYQAAEEMKNESMYLWVCALIEEEDYLNAYQKLKTIRSYSKAEEIYDELTELVYLEGQLLYQQGEYYKAKNYFTSTASYMNSKKYMTLINAHTFTWDNGDRIASNLVDIFYFEDASKLLLSKHSIAKCYLKGKWSGEGYYFKMDTAGHISYDLPWFEYGDYYTISNGDVLLYPKDNVSKTKKLFSFEALTPDSMEVYCHKNGQSYTLKRKE